MSDISACCGKQCPDKMNCLRFRGIRNQYWQSYGAYDAERLKEPNKPCSHFVKMYGDERLRVLEPSEQ
jgi:hypothetical protein